MIQSQKKTRIEWLDAMRGFTMILVVMFHVSTQSFCQLDNSSSSTPFLLLFRMPLFFFVSGFLVYKPTFEWRLRNTYSLVAKKVRIQLLPTIIFFILCVSIRHENIFVTMVEFLSTPAKGGYWFTWSLLHLFLFYYTIQIVLNKFSKSRKIKWDTVFIIFWCITVLLYFMLFMPSKFNFNTPFWAYSSLTQTIKYLQFFIVGILARHYWGQIENIFDSKNFSLFIIIISVVCSLECLKFHNFSLPVEHVIRLVAIYSLVIIVLMFFRFYKDSFSRNTIIGQSLQYIGTRTLDIYLIHFIRLPVLPSIGSFLSLYRPNFLLEIVLSLLVSLIVIGGCLIISNILRVSPILSKYLFGR